MYVIMGTDSHSSDVATIRREASIRDFMVVSMREPFLLITKVFDQTDQNDNTESVLDLLGNYVPVLLLKYNT